MENAICQFTCVGKPTVWIPVYARVNIFAQQSLLNVALPARRECTRQIPSNGLVKNHAERVYVAEDGGRLAFENLRSHVKPRSRTRGSGRGRWRNLRQTGCRNALGLQSIAVGHQAH